MFAQPLNTYSNLIIVLFGILAFAAVLRRAPRAYDLYAPCALLIANGVGSFLWHGVRDRALLFWDVTPALIFLLVIVFAWARRIAPWWQTVIVFALFAASVVVVRYTGFGFRGGLGPWTTLAPVVIAAGLWLIYRTRRISTEVAWMGAATLGLAIVGLVFRTVDRPLCDAFPYGTHWLWHIFLSGGAYIGIRALIRLVRIRGADRNASLNLAEIPAQ